MTFRVRQSDLNTANLNNLAASLFPAISIICATGAVISQLNIGQIQIQDNASAGSVLVCQDSTGNATWGSASSLNSETMLFSGLWASSVSAVVSAVKTGKSVNINIPQITAVSNKTGSISSSNFVLPLNYNLSTVYIGNTLYSPVILTDSSQNKAGLMTTTFTAGPSNVSLNFNVFTSTGSNFGGNGSTSGLNTTTITYSTDT